MKLLSENYRDLHILYVHQLRMMLSAEEQIVRSLPDLIVHAADEQLRQAFQSHLQETEEQIRRLEQILAREKASDPAVDSISPVKCKAIAALAGEADDMMLDARDAWVRDAGLIAVAQRIEHYEIASYGTLRSYAETLGDTEAALLLDKTAKEEGHADHLLTTIAERINPYAKRVAA